MFSYKLSSLNASLQHAADCCRPDHTQPGRLFILCSQLVVVQHSNIMSVNCEGKGRTERKKEKKKKRGRAMVCVSADSEESGEKWRFYGQRTEGGDQSAEREKCPSKTGEERKKEEEQREAGWDDVCEYWVWHWFSQTAETTNVFVRRGASQTETGLTDSDSAMAWAQSTLCSLRVNSVYKKPSSTELRCNNWTWWWVNIEQSGIKAGWRFRSSGRSRRISSHFYFTYTWHIT